MRVIGFGSFFGYTKHASKLIETPHRFRNRCRLGVLFNFCKRLPLSKLYRCLQTIIVINVFYRTMTEGCIHKFEKRDNIKSEYFECIKCFQKHRHNKGCMSICKYRGSVCRLTGFKIHDVQTNYYDEQPCPYVRRVCTKLKMQDYVRLLLRNMTPSDKTEEYKEDDKNILKILNTVISTEETLIKVNVKKQPFVLALMIILNYYGKLIAKDGVIKNEDRINLIRSTKEGSRKMEYALKMKNSKHSVKYINHRKIWKLFSQLRFILEKICRGI